MNDGLQLTRRGLFHVISTFIATATFAARRPLFRLPDAEIVEGERPSPRVTSYKQTKLETFLKSRGIKPANLARESGYTRQHLLRVRMGRIEPDARCMRAIVEAARRLSGEYVRGSDLFGAAAIHAGISW